MAHANAPLTPEGRRRLIERIILDGRPISHVAAEAGVSRQRLSVWLHRFELLGEAGLEDRSSRPARSPNQTPPTAPSATARRSVVHPKRARVSPMSRSSFHWTATGRSRSIWASDTNVPREHS